eukprot:10818988-Heterocapsa_arctica.AAC.1
MGKDLHAQQPGFLDASGGRYDPTDGRDGAQHGGEADSDAVLRSLDRRLPWNQGGEEEPGIH